MKKSKNIYYLYRHGHEPVEINIHHYVDPFDDVCLTYWVRVLSYLEDMLSFANLTFYIIWDTETVRDLPSYGKNVVVLLLMDEFCEIPPYFGKVGFIFKTHGFFPYMNTSLRGKNLAFLVKSLRDGARWGYRSGFQALQHRGSIHREAGGMVVPLGYARQTDIAVKPFKSRRYLVSFIGSVKQRPYHPLSIRAILGTPKDIARSRMMRELQQLAATMPDDVFWSDTRSYRDGILSDGVLYSEVMADTKICLAPRGSSAETFRLFEAMRQGCIVICDRVPRHWFYEDCPFVQIDDWAELRARVTELCADPQRLLELHDLSLAWWEKRCSERSLAAVMASRLDRSLAST